MPRPPSRTAARVLGIVAGAGLLLAACGPDTSARPGPTGPDASPTEAAVASLPPLPTEPETTFVLPSFVGDDDLEAMFPETIGGEAVSVLSMNGKEFLGDGTRSPEIVALLTTLGKTPDDLSVAFGGAAKMTVIAYRIKDVPGQTTLDGLIAAYASQIHAVISDASFAGKPVKKVVSPDAQIGTSYVYAAGDAVFIVGGDGATDTLLTEVFASLP